LREVVDSYPLTLSNPPPVVSMKAFGSSSIDFEIFAWTEATNVTKTRSEVYQAINTAFNANGIDIPFPTQTVAEPRNLKG
jgi:small conductance mechanosensitive channel